jgi:hypothetical protein
MTNAEKAQLAILERHLRRALEILKAITEFDTDDEGSVTLYDGSLETIRDFVETVEGTI